MGTVEIIIVVAVGVAFLSALGVIIYKKVKHKGGCCGCDCGCGSCNCRAHGDANNHENE